MKKPYKKAFEIPAFLLVAFLVKKETVNGIIGKTHGVSKATKPPKKPSNNMLSKLLEVFVSVVCTTPQSLIGLLISIVLIRILAV